MRDEHERHASVGRQGFQQVGECFEPAGGRADAHDGKGKRWLVNRFWSDVLEPLAYGGRRHWCSRSTEGGGFRPVAFPIALPVAFSAGGCHT
jgi:hypothetical protein